MFTILDRYLMSEVTKTLLAILSVLVLILAGHTFIRYLGKVAAGMVSHDVMLNMLGLELAKEFGLLLPPAFFFAVLMTLGRMYRDSEMTALFAGGVDRGRIFRAYAWIVIPVMILAGAVMLYGKPVAQKALKEYKEQQEEGSDIVNLSAGKFNESNKGDLIFYVEELTHNNTQMKNLFVQIRRRGKMSVIKAESGYQYHDAKTGERYIVMLNGYQYEGKPGQYTYTVSQFDKYAVRLEDADETKVQMEPKLRTTAELLASNNLHDKIELQLRFSAPLAVFVFAVLSIPLSRASPRQGMAGRMLLAILIYFIFFNLQALSGKWMEKGITPLWMGRWWIHVSMLGLAAFLIMRDTLWYAAMMRRFKAKLWRREA